MEFQFGNVDHVFVLPTGQVACRKESLKGIIPHGIIVTPDPRREDLEVDDDEGTYKGWEEFTGRPATAIEMDWVIRMEYDEFGPQYHNDILGRRFWKLYETGLSQWDVLETRITTFIYNGEAVFVDLQKAVDWGKVFEKFEAKIGVPREVVVLPVHVLDLLAKLGYGRFLTHGSSVEFFKVEAGASLIARFEVQVLGDERAYISILRDSIRYQTDTNTYVKYYDNDVFGAVESFINEVLKINQTYVFPAVYPYIKPTE